MNKYAWAYKHHQHWLTDVYDMFKGSGHCRKEFGKWAIKEVEREQIRYNKATNEARIDGHKENRSEES